MLPVYICGGTGERTENYIHVINEYIRKYRSRDISIVCASKSPTDLLDYLQHHLQQSLYILDSRFDAPMNGIELASEIRKIDPRAYIVMITDRPEELAFNHHTEAMDCIELQSSDTDRRIYQCLDNARLLHHRFYHSHEDQVINLVLDDVHLSFPSSDLLFINTIPEKSHGIELHTTGRNYKYRGNLEKISPVLDYTFRRCHKSYIVNLQHVSRIDDTHTMLYLDSGDSVPVSHRSVNEIVQYLRLLNKN